MTLIAKTYWGGAPFDFREPPASARIEPIKLITEDARELRGIAYRPSEGKARAGVLVMHPRVDFSRHYMVPGLVDAGIAVLALTSRNPNDDTDTVHEELVLDVAAGVAELGRTTGAVVLLGNSGGGSLMALYQAQAARSPEERIARTPAGAPTMLQRARLHPADGLVLVAAHRGQGHVLARCIDPAVIDEHDPSIEDPALDMYAEANGFAPPPSFSAYDASFVERYRAAQIDRVRRLDAIAHALIAPSIRARREARLPAFETLPFRERQAVERALHARRVMVVYRTMANLDYVDPSLDPSPREYGSLLSERPDLMNGSLPGFARTVTPRAWLSTWSAFSSNADLARTLPEVRVPLLVVHAERDKEVYPRHDIEPIRAAIESEDAASVTIAEAGHYFEPAFGERRAPQLDALMDVVVPWITERFAR